MKRSCTALINGIPNAPPAFTAALISTLAQKPALSCLALLQGATAQHCEWALGSRELLPPPTSSAPSLAEVYLRQRAYPPGAEKVSARIGLGLDVLGPRKRKATMEGPPLKLLTGPATTTEAGQPSTSCDPPPSPPVGCLVSDPLQSLLSWSGELTADVAADRASQIMSMMHKNTEELGLAKLQLQYYQERDAIQAQVCSLNHPYPLALLADHAPIAVFAAFVTNQAGRGNEERQQADGGTGLAA